MEEKLETVIEICERKQKQGREKHENFRGQSLSNYGFPANLPFAFEQFLLLQDNLALKAWNTSLSVYNIRTRACAWYQNEFRKDDQSK